MQYLIMLIVMLTGSFQGCWGFNIISLDKALIEHQKALKDFEQHIPTCKASWCAYGNTTEYNYEFSSIEAKKSFNNYKNKLNNLDSKIYDNLFLRGFLLGLLTTTHDRFLKKELFNQNAWLLNFSASLALLLYDNLSRPKEPYIGLGNFKKYDNLFALNNLENLNKIVIILTFGLLGRFGGEVVVKKF